MLTVTAPVNAQTGSNGALPIPPAPAAEQELLLLVDVNDQKLGETVLALELPGGAIAVQGESLDHWRLRRPRIAPRVFHGTAYYPLDSIKGVTYAFDSAKQRLAITASPDAFESAQYMSVAAPYAQPTRSPLGGFLNYDLFASHGSGVTQYGGQFEAGLFTSRGVLTSSQLEQDNGDRWSSVRLDTTWRSDFPASRATLVLGDSISMPAAWGRAVRFGGIQYQTNFTVQPGFIAYPSIAANGSAALPSTVDVFVHNALVAQRPVAPGPFSITNIPTVNGSGDVQLVVRDLFGREQVITQPFYGSVNLLKAGLDQFSYEAGVERQNFGTDSDEYGPGVASATWRRGLTNEFTGEMHAEATRDVFAGGVAANYLWRQIGVLSASLAGSGGGAGGGALGGLGFQRQTSSWNVAAQGAWSSRNFSMVGATPDAPVPMRLWSATVGYQADRHGSFNATFVAQDFRTRSNMHVLALGYGVRLGPWVFFNVTAAKTFGEGASTSLQATFTVPVGELTTASTAYVGTRSSSQPNTNDGVFRLQKSLPLGEGYGYDLTTHTHDEYEGGFAYQNNFGSYSIEAARFQGANSERLGASGGIGMVAGHPFLSRQITDSFAVVRVADYPGIGVLQDNQLAGRTGADGYAILPTLRAYDVNPVSIDPNDLPLDAQVDKLKIDVVPYFRSGLLLDFPVRRAHGGTLHILLDDGAPMPSGALVRIVDRPEEFPVALDGEAYLTGLEPHNRLRVTWKGRSCEFDADVPRTSDPIPELGSFVCHGVAR